MAKQMFDIVIGGKFVRTMLLEPCRICGGHPAITKKPALHECLGHLNLRPHIKTVEAVVEEG